MARRMKKKTRNRLFLVLILIIGYVYLYGVPPALFEMMSGAAYLEEMKPGSMGNYYEHDEFNNPQTHPYLNVGTGGVITNAFTHGEIIDVTGATTHPGCNGCGASVPHYIDWVVRVVDEYQDVVYEETIRKQQNLPQPGIAWFHAFGFQFNIDSSTFPSGDYEIQVFKLGISSAPDWDMTSPTTMLLDYDVKHPQSPDWYCSSHSEEVCADTPRSIVYFKQITIIPEECIYDPASEIPVTDVFINGETITTSALSSNFVKFCERKPAYIYGLTKGQEVEPGKYIPVAATIDRDYRVYSAIESGSVTVPPGYVYEITYIAQNELDFDCTGDTAFDPVTDQCISTGFLRSAREGQFFFVDDAGTIFLGAVATETCPAGSYWNDDEGRCIVDRCEEGYDWFEPYQACGLRIPYSDICSYGGFSYETSKCEAHIGDISLYDPTGASATYQGQDPEGNPIVDIVYNPSEYESAEAMFRDGCNHELILRGNDYYCAVAPSYTCPESMAFTVEDRDYPACLFAVGSGLTIEFITPDCPEGTTPREGFCLLTRTDIIELTTIEYQDQPVYPITPQTQLTVNPETGDLEVTESKSAIDMFKSPLMLATLGLGGILGFLYIKPRLRLRRR